MHVARQIIFVNILRALCTDITVGLAELGLRKRSAWANQLLFLFLFCLCCRHVFALHNI